MGTKRPWDIKEGNHLMTENGINYMLSFLTIAFAILSCFCHRKIIFASLMALDKFYRLQNTCCPYLHDTIATALYTAMMIQNMSYPCPQRDIYQYEQIKT